MIRFRSLNEFLGRRFYDPKWKQNFTELAASQLLNSINCFIHDIFYHTWCIILLSNISKQSMQTWSAYQVILVRNPDNIWKHSINRKALAFADKILNVSWKDPYKYSPNQPFLTWTPSCKRKLKYTKLFSKISAQWFI